MKLHHLHEARVQDYYGGPYGFGYSDNREVWDAVRNHPLFIDAVLSSIRVIEVQIEEIEGYQADHPNGIKHSLSQAMADLGELSSIGREIANDVGWGDPNDIIIAIQRHPLVMEKLKERDEKKKRRDNFQAF